MKTLYLDCAMGAAGDMLGAALLELISNSEEFMQAVEALKIPNVHMQANNVTKCGIRGTHISVTVGGKTEHTHAHTHHHAHSGMHDIEEIVSQLPVSARVKTDVMKIYRIIAEAESHVHGVPVTEIHFHEVGTMDAIADIVFTCMLMEVIAPEQVIVSPVHVGSGQVSCAHGILPVPAPATAYILRDVPIYGGEVKGELCTPTGAALLKYFASAFGDMPLMKISAIGYGMGEKDFTAANCVRAMLGKTEERGADVAELSCNLDDMTAEEIGFAMQSLLAAGAPEVYTVPIGMKKNRLGTCLCLLCDCEKREEMLRLLFKHTTTLGVREQIMRRYTLERRVETVPTAFGDIRKKISVGFGVKREKYEYDDVARAATERGMAIADVVDAIEGKK